VFGGVRPIDASALTLMWDASPDPAVAGYVVYVGTSSGFYTDAIDVGDTTTFTFNVSQPGQTYYFAVASYADGPIVGPPSAEVTARSDSGPTLLSPGNQRHAKGKALSVQLTGSDVDGDPLTYAASGLPPGLTIDATVGVIFGTPTTGGKYSVTASVSDGQLSASQPFSWTIDAAPPTAPTLVSPSGSLTTATPTFVWNALSTATSYRLWVDDAASGTTAVQKDYTPTQAGCGAGTGQCSANPGVALAPGAATWSVMASNTAGNGPWSGSMSFVVPSPGDSTAPTIAITSPTSTGSYTTSRNAVALKGTASDNVGVIKVTWVNTLGGSGTATGTTSWSASVPLKAGTNMISVKAVDAKGNSRSAVIAVSMVAPTSGGGRSGGAKGKSK
jgi:hypothetical protein